jgi:hypothetical protein
MRFRSITTLCLFGAAAFVALKYPLIGLGICICCLIVYLLSNGLGHGTQHHCGIIRIVALLAWHARRECPKRPQARTQNNVDPTVMRRAVSWQRPRTCPARGAGLPHAASGSRSGGSSLWMNPARFTVIHQATNTWRIGIPVRALSDQAKPISHTARLLATPSGHRLITEGR